VRSVCVVQQTNDGDWRKRASHLYRTNACAAIGLRPNRQPANASKATSPGTTNHANTRTKTPVHASLRRWLSLPWIAARLPSDPDALTYLAAVAAADGAPVETAVAVAVDDFFKGCKADPSGTPGSSNWDAIKASCILCGAQDACRARWCRLVGTAPTNVADGFVSGDYTRGGATPGLKGDGTSYLDSGRAEDAERRRRSASLSTPSANPSVTSPF
jgi:hypothetical protein